MDTTKILADLHSERERIDRAIAALEALGANSIETTGRPRSGAPNQAAARLTTTPGRRTMSAAARRKISEAAKRRWAAQKSKTDKPQANAKHIAPKQTATKRGITAAGRKRISEMMKKRWAERKKAAAKG
jgi:hypothetical protein